MNEKHEYFPRKMMFEEAQDLIVTFYSRSENYFTDNNTETTTFLDENGVADDFYYNLLLYSLVSVLDEIISLSSRIIKKMKSSRVFTQVDSNFEILGELDVEEYIQKNRIKKVFPKVYPSIVKLQTYQIPEYQITKYIIDHCVILIKELLDMLDYDKNKGFGVFLKANKAKNKLESLTRTLRNKYGINYRDSDSYFYLKKKVIYRYRNRKIIEHSYIRLMQLYEGIFKFNGLNHNSDKFNKFFESSASFDDRLFEIWLLKRISESFNEILRGEIEYRPLYFARQYRIPAVEVKNSDVRFEVFFQNRVSLLDYDRLKWYFYDDGKEKKIGAIPDIVIRKKTTNQDAEMIVLIDAKNRSWTIPEDQSRIKPEVVQQIYIQNNFNEIFEENFKSVIISHNIRSYESRIFMNYDNSNYEINVISMDFNDKNTIQNSLDKLSKVLIDYLGGVH